jgi:hypothetical protein
LFLIGYGFFLISTWELQKQIDGVIVSGLALSVVDCEFEPQSSQTKD